MKPDIIYLALVSPTCSWTFYCDTLPSQPVTVIRSFLPFSLELGLIVQSTVPGVAHCTTSSTTEEIVCIPVFTICISSTCIAIIRITPISQNTNNEISCITLPYTGLTTSSYNIIQQFNSCMTHKKSLHGQTSPWTAEVEEDTERLRDRTIPQSVPTWTPQNMVCSTLQTAAQLAWRIT